MDTAIALYLWSELGTDRSNDGMIYYRCHYGYKCRYLGAHIDADGKLIKDEAKMATAENNTMNVFSHDLTLNLRSFKVPTLNVVFGDLSEVYLQTKRLKSSAAPFAIVRLLALRGIPEEDDR